MLYDFIAYFILFVSYFFLIMPIIGCFLTKPRSDYKEDMKAGFFIHISFVVIAMFVFLILWALNRVFTL